MSGERILAPAPTLGFGARNPPSPLQYYTSGVESLRVTLYSYVAGAAVVLSGRTWSASDGRIVSFQERYTSVGGFPNGSQFDYILPAGALLNVRIGIDGTNVSPGMLFAQLQLVTGRGNTATVISTLAQGYISKTSDVAWPGSPIEDAAHGPGFLVNVGWTPAAVPLRATTTVPVGFRYRVVAANIGITTSGVIADRSVHTQLINSGGTLMFTGSGAPVIPAGTTKSVNLLPGMGPSQIDVASVVHLPWPPDLDLTEGMILRVFVANEQAGDALTLNGLLVRSWFDL